MMLKRADGTFLDVEYDVEQHGHSGNGWDDAGEPTIAHITEARVAGTDEQIDLSDDERWQLEEQLCEKLDAEPWHDDSDDHL
jgi:hypothetical protein